MSQKRFADLIDVSYTALNEVVNGNAPSIPNMR